MLNIGILARRSEGKDPPGDRRLRGAGLPDTVPAMPPSLGAAVGLGLRALVRESWLLAVGVLVAIARRAAMWPAWAVAAAMLWGGAAEAIELGALDPGAPLRGALAVAGSPRFLVLVAGLWLTGTALGAVLRVAYLAGVLPTLAGALAGDAGGRRFARGIAYGLPPVLTAGVLAMALDLSGGLFGLTLALAGLRVSVHAAGTGASPLLAGAVALALTLALAVPLSLSAVADAAVARAAVRREGPGRAFATATTRFLARPGTFVLAAMGFAAAGPIAASAVEAMGGALTGFAVAASPLLLAGPNLMIALLAVAMGAAVDLWWLGTVAALSCGEDG
jgi:hypothetical protein